ncbi:MAG: hypothetical protein SGJ00_07750 [bacterium]|nr:hypothetical protein [bacterium]
MFIKNKFVTIVCSVLILFGFSNCTNSKNESISSSFIVSIKKPISIQNSSKYVAQINIYWDGSFYTIDSILKEIERMPNEYKEEPLERKSWRFVINHMDFYRNPLESSDIHYPLVQLNSLGYGQCDDLATLLYFIWKAQGFNARIWGLGKHIVPEVMANGKWQMYDPAFQAYYLNDKGIPANVTELTENNSLILTPIKTISLKESNNIQKRVIDSLRYSMSVCRHYLSPKPHFVNKSYYQTFQINDFAFQMPPHSTIILPISKPELLQELDWENKNRENGNYLKLILNSNSIGQLKIPLILVAVEGDVTFRTSLRNNLEYSFVEKNAIPLEIIDTLLTIVKVKTTASLYYKLPERFKQNTTIHVDNKAFDHISVSQEIPNVLDIP